jgi:RNA-binding protein 5/10
LEDLGASIDQTTVITDRTTGLSKRYGFAKFSSVEHARAFVEPNYPTVAWKEPAGMGPGLEDGLNIKINFSQKTGGWKNEQGSDPRISDNQRNQPGSFPVTVPDVIGLLSHVLTPLRFKSFPRRHLCEHGYERYRISA